MPMRLASFNVSPFDICFVMPDQPSKWLIFRSKSRIHFALQPIEDFSTSYQARVPDDFPDGNPLKE
jgi:hypothetical protein